jgi:hypothetical protein
VVGAVVVVVVVVVGFVGGWRLVVGVRFFCFSFVDSEGSDERVSFWDCLP